MSCLSFWSDSIVGLYIPSVYDVSELRSDFKCCTVNLQKAHSHYDFNLLTLLIKHDSAKRSFVAIECHSYAILNVFFIISFLSAYLDTPRTVRNVPSDLQYSIL